MKFRFWMQVLGFWIGFSVNSPGLSQQLYHCLGGYYQDRPCDGEAQGAAADDDGMNKAPPSDKRTSSEDRSVEYAKNVRCDMLRAQRDAMRNMQKPNDQAEERFAKIIHDTGC